MRSRTSTLRAACSTTRSWLSSFLSAGHGVASAVPHPHAAVRMEQGAVDERYCRLNRKHGGVCASARWGFSGWSARACRKSPPSLPPRFTALNPNLLYMQTTAMNEPLYLAFFIWAIVYFDEWLRRTIRRAAIVGAWSFCRSELSKVVALLLPEERRRAMTDGSSARSWESWCCGRSHSGGARRPTAHDAALMTKSLAEFLLLNALVPVFWLAYNHRVSGRAMDWANGPYSARAIAERTTARGAAPYPGKDHTL